MKKRGLILPTVLVLISVLVLLALTRHFFSRQQLHFADLLSEKEQAYYIAAGLREIAVKKLRQTLDFLNSGRPETFPKLEKCEISCRPLLEKLLSTSGEPAGKAFNLALKNNALDEYIEMVKNAGLNPSSAEVTVEFLPGKPLFENAPRGMVADPAEIFWKLILRCQVTVEKTGATAAWYKEGRTISIQPPVIGKFSLFMPEPDQTVLNTTDDNNRQYVIIANGDIADRETLDQQAAASFLDRQGWVYLGENTETGMRLNRHSPLLNRNFFISAMDDADYLSSLGTFAWYHYCDGFEKSLKNSPDGIAPFAEFPDDQILPTAALLFNGSSDAPSPTVVIGRVLRKYPIIQGMTGKKSGKRFPFPAISEETFMSSNWPCRLKPAEAEMIKRNFSGSYPGYQQRMSFIYSEPFNTANFQLLKLGKTHSDFAILQPSALPAEVRNLPVSDRLKANATPAGFFDMVLASAYSMSDDRGRLVFNDAPFSSVNDLSFLRQRAVLVCPDFAEFVRKTAGPKGAIAVPGAAMIESEVKISKPLEISDAGGILLVKGNVSISAPVKTANKALSSIISLGGNISVADNVTVDAGLICLSGMLQTGRNCEINGTVACKQLKTDLAGNRPTRFTFNKLSDPTDSQAVRGSYRFCPEEKEYYLVE